MAEAEIEMLSAKEVARELGTDARTFRKFMRATLPKEEQPGQGNRYEIDPDEVDEIRSNFKRWSKSLKPKADGDEPTKPKKKSKRSKQVEAEEIEELDDEDLVDLDDLDDPSDEDLEDLEDEDLDIEEL